MRIRPHRASDFDRFVASFDDEVRFWQGYDDATVELSSAGNTRARRPIASIGGFPVDERVRYALPDGRVVDGIWYVHTDDTSEVRLRGTGAWLT